MTTTLKETKAGEEKHSTTVDAETLQRVLNAQPFLYTPQEIERDAKRYASKPFAIVK